MTSLLVCESYDSGSRTLTLSLLVRVSDHFFQARACSTKVRLKFSAVSFDAVPLATICKSKSSSKLYFSPPCRCIYRSVTSPPVPAFIGVFHGSYKFSSLRRPAPTRANFVTKLNALAHAPLHCPSAPPVLSNWLEQEKSLFPPFHIDTQKRFATNEWTLLRKFQLLKHHRHCPYLYTCSQNRLGNSRLIFISTILWYPTHKSCTTIFLESSYTSLSGLI